MARNDDNVNEQPQQQQQEQQCADAEQRKVPNAPQKITQKVKRKLREYVFLTTVESWEELDKFRFKV
jgi:hypothetical protein